jgi:hypothetical protein
MNQKLNIQKQIFKWFEDVSDKELVSFINNFVFELPLEDRDLLEAFLIDNGLEKLYENYKFDSDNPKSELAYTEFRNGIIIQEFCLPVKYSDKELTLKQQLLYSKSRGEVGWNSEGKLVCFDLSEYKKY